MLSEVTCAPSRREEKKMNAKTSVALATAIAALVVASSLFALPAMAAIPSHLLDAGSGGTTTSTQSSSSTTSTSAITSTASSTTSTKSPPPIHAPSGLQVGDTVTYTSLLGGYYTQGTSKSNGQSTPASATITFKVTQVLSEGVVLTISSGSITVGQTTYAITGGMAQSGHQGIDVVGQGTAGTGVAFLVRSNDIGVFGSTHTTRVGIDLSNGTAEYLLNLLCTVSIVSPVASS